MQYLGVKQKDSVECYEMPQSTVCNIISRGRDNNDASSIEKRGRKRKLSRTSICALLKYARKKRFKSATAIASEFIASTGLTISTKTVRRYSCLSQYGQCPAIRIPQ